MGNQREGTPAAASCGILVTGHGRFADGLVSAVEVIMGSQQGLYAVDFPETDTAAQLRENLAGALDGLREYDTVVAFCDLRGGSPFNVMLELRGGRNGVELFYGANLPLLLEFIGKRGGGEPLASLIASAGADGRSGLDRFEEPATDDAPSDPDDDWA
ncbi:PTS sugar transporter subunit IIA [Streptomyces sp. NPDC058045]|uniref:PTS sugar transporter subunit IIA n=1 Tax=Streptomyces sp. NPDC058045 TaxID=3346311 RepID=UPI0036E22DEE